MAKDIRNKFFRFSGFDTGFSEADEAINSSGWIRYNGLPMEYYFKIIIYTGFVRFIEVVSRAIS